MQRRRTRVLILFVAVACVGYVLAVRADSWLRYVCIGLASALATFAQDYADRNERDFAALGEAVRSGRVRAEGHP